MWQAFGMLNLELMIKVVYKAGVLYLFIQRALLSRMDVFREKQDGKSSMSMEARLHVQEC